MYTWATRTEIAAAEGWRVFEPQNDRWFNEAAKFCATLKTKEICNFVKNKLQTTLKLIQSRQTLS